MSYNSYYPDNDYRLYLMHSAKGSHWKGGHKYIAKKRGKNGKWIYIYPEDLKNGAKDLLDKAKDLVGLESAEEVEALEEMAEEATELAEEVGEEDGKASDNLKEKIFDVLKKPVEGLSKNKTLNKTVDSLKKTSEKAVENLDKPLKEEASSETKVSSEASEKKASKVALSGEASEKPRNDVVSAQMTVRVDNDGKAEPVKSAPNDPSMDHSKSNKMELASYLLGLGYHLQSHNRLGMLSDAVRAAQAVNSSKKVKAAEEIRNQSSVDSSTGLHVKSKEMSKTEDMALVNPGYKNFDANTKNNCMLCTTAYDLRRRGYEVSAKKASTGYSAYDCTRWYKDGKVEDISYTFQNNESSRKHHANETISYLEKQGNGARGNLMVYWATGGGHSMAYEIENNKVVIYDCQTNTVYHNPHDILDNTVSSQCMRLDNLEVDYEYIKEAVR